MTIAEVQMFGTRIGAVSWDEERNLASFQYDREFAEPAALAGIQLAPFCMPLNSDVPYEFPALNHETFKGLPGMLAESLPDKFGNALIDQWLARQGRESGSFNPVERLCYIGKRGLGALEYLPARGPELDHSERIDLASLVELTSDILTKKSELNTNFFDKNREKAMQHILAVGTSAGGARAKAIIAYNESTKEVRSGQIEAGEGFTYWLLKFDGVTENKDKELSDPKGFGLIEYAYYKMAVKAKIKMTRCELLKENGRSHFMTMRFDRTMRGEKVHMQSLCALRHFDFNQAGAYSYEQAVETIRMLGLGKAVIEEQYRRACFNIIARNQDDHVKNISFLMDEDGNWSLSPAYDLAYSYNPTGLWTNQHQMTFNGKRNDFTKEDFIAFADFAEITKNKAIKILGEVDEAVSSWQEIAKGIGVYPDHIAMVQNALRLNMI